MKAVKMAVTGLMVTVILGAGASMASASTPDPQRPVVAGHHERHARDHRSHETVSTSDPSSVDPQTVSPDAPGTPNEHKTNSVDTKKKDPASPDKHNGNDRSSKDGKQGSKDRSVR